MSDNPKTVDEDLASNIVRPQLSLEDEIRDVLNRHSAENGSNTPDFILAEFLIGCLSLWDRNVTRRENWYTVTRPSPRRSQS